MDHGDDTQSSEVDSVEDIVERLPEFFTIACASKRNSGKTVLISELIQILYEDEHIDMVLVMSGSAGLNDDYNFLPAGLVMPYSESVLHKLWARQAATPKKERQRVLVVLDDCLATPEAIQSKMLTRIYALGRHVAISCIIISQVANWILTPTIKQNSDMILWSKLNRQQLENLWSSMTNINKKEFIAFSEAEGGKDFNFLCFDNYSASTDPMEFLTIVRAEPPDEEDEEDEDDE
jgi:hypothetical protein